MLALVLILLAFASGLTPGELDQDGASSERTASECCEMESERDAVPCTPGDSCPAPGAGCTCVFCCKRIADTPLGQEPDEQAADSLELAPWGALPGIDGMRAVWHPPQA